ncbi:MAG: hypothetical protein SOY42_07410 [Clostridium sp.]|nr:hypothetical protein [Clostridium sp.]
MYNFEYVSPQKYKPVKKELIKLINLVQDEVREYFTFDFRFIGSSSRNMITCDKTSNIGYDFDVNLIINDENNEFTAKEIKKILMNAFNKHKDKFKYNKIEDSKRVITIKVVDHKNSKILHSCDFAVVNYYIDDDGNEWQEFIFHNKKQNSYEWQEQKESFYLLPDKINWLKKMGLWQNVRNYYLEKKNKNTNPNKKSRSLYAEAVNDIYHNNCELNQE